MGTSFAVRDFDAEIALEKERAASGDDRMFTLEEHTRLLESAKAQSHKSGYDEGVVAGKKAEREDILAETQSLLAELSPKVDEFLGNVEEHNGRLEQQVLEFILSATEKVLPEVLMEWGRDRITQEIRATISRCTDKPTLNIYVSEKAAYEMRAQIETLGKEKGFKGELSVLGSSDMARGDVRVEWDNGFMEYKLSEICDQIISSIRSAKANDI